MSRPKRTLPREILTDAEAEAVLLECGETLSGLRNRALLLLLDGTGCRIAEVLAFEPKDFEWEEELVNVRCGKGGKQRVVPVSPEALVAVRTWLDVRRDLGIADGAPVVCNLHGRAAAIKPERVRSLLPDLAKKAGITKRVHAHGFRHRFTIRLVRHGVPITSVSHILGHGNIATTHIYCQRIGASHAIDDVRAALDAE